MRWRIFLPLLLLLLPGAARAAEVIPAAPADHFNDYAGLVRPATARQLETQLTQFERDSSNQLLVAIYPHMQSESSIEDYTVRVAQAWKVGRHEQKNGAVLFIFSQDRKLFVQVGYGLEGVLPDALCKRIIENEITPRFRQGDYDGGLQAGVRALIAATRGEYQGTGRTVADRGRRSPDGNPFVFILLFVIIVFIAVRQAFRRNTIYSRSGRISPWITPGSWGGGGFGGGSSGGGGGSFSGGGGSFGGGGAGGSW